MPGARGPIAQPRGLRIVPAEQSAVRSKADTVRPQAPNPPAGMSDECRAVWDEYVPLLDQAGLLAAVDGLTLRLMFETYLTAVMANRDIRTTDCSMLYDEKNQRYQKLPAEAVARSNTELFVKIAAQMGMTYVSRARVPLADDAGSDADENPFAPRETGS